MSLIQRFFMAVLPKSWAKDLKDNSERWQFRCKTCGTTRTVWEAGGLRGGAASAGKISGMYCTECRTFRAHAVEPVPGTSP